MIKIKPQNPKGVRDYLPAENRRREYILSIIRQQFELFGFQAIYTPSFERLDTLQGKYGEEGDKLLFKILNSGEYITDSAKKNIQQDSITYSELTKEISSKGLRYDLTVPLARMVSQHQNELQFPFKRYHIAPVWRADRPQKGRYQEFFQCDADIVGTKGLIADIDLIDLIDTVFHKLNLKVEIKINNRKIYNGICEYLEIINQSSKVSTILDKWDKIGEDMVQEELTKIIPEDKSKALLAILKDNSLEKIQSLNDLSAKGVEEVEQIMRLTQSECLRLDLRLLRGLDYYTGTVLECVSTETKFGSILGGGRYDNLTEIFGMKDISGIGISFGLDRIYDLMEELHRFPESIASSKILVVNLIESAVEHYFSLLRTLRSHNHIVDLYPSIAKMDKQLSYADKAGYSYAIIIGEDEIAKDTLQIKNLKARTQHTMKNTSELIAFFQSENEK